MSKNNRAGVPRNYEHRSNGVTVLSALTDSSVTKLDSTVSRLRCVLDALLALLKVSQGYGSMWTGCLRPWFEGVASA